MDGILERVGDRSVLRFRRELGHRREKVWRALTEPEHLTGWFPTSIDGERAAGAHLRFSFPVGEGDGFDGEMIAYEPPALLEFRWGPDTLRFELEESGRNTILTFTDTFGEIGRAARDAAGWHASLDVLEYELDDKPAPWTPTERWADVHDRYVEEFPSEGSTVGPPSG
jgi:uncharacterized protein YndB with AHSA1/START domain